MHDAMGLARFMDCDGLDTAGQRGGAPPNLFIDSLTLPKNLTNTILATSILRRCSGHRVGFDQRS